MKKTINDLINELSAVDIDDMNDHDEHVTKDEAEELIREAFELGKKETVKFYHTLDEDAPPPPRDKYLLVRFEGEHEGGRFQFCILKENGWYNEEGISSFPSFWSYVEKPN